MKILIIKLGALGDVVRTTPLLRVLKGEITWVTKPNAVPLLRGRSLLKEVIEIGNAFHKLANAKFDLVLSLDEEPLAAELASRIKKRELIGTYKSLANVQYTDSAREWFDMSLISRLGKEKADKKKWGNRESYQEIIFRMVGKKFKGEEYLLPTTPSANSPLLKGGPPSVQWQRGYWHPPLFQKGKNRMIGLETRAGERWIAKRWPHFDRLMEMLKKNHFSYIQFVQSPSLTGFLRQIYSTHIVITTDSLALHFALGLKKKVIALFTCTSPHEIYSYGRMIKIVSPLLKKHFYTTAKTLESGNAIAPSQVFTALKKIMYNS